MLTPSFRKALLNAIVMVALAALAFAGPVNCAATPSDPACAPTLTLTYQLSGGGPIHFSPGGVPVYSNGSWETTFTPQTFPAFLFTGGELTSAPDPFVGATFGVINAAGSNMNFTFDFVTPYSGLLPLLLARTTFVGTLIDSDFAGNQKVSPFGDPFIMETYVNGVLIPGFGRGTGCSIVATPGGFCISGASGPLGPILYTSPATGTLEIKGAFTLTPGGFFTMSGRSEVYTPEPGSLVLLGTGILGLAGMARRRFLG